MDGLSLLVTRLCLPLPLPPRLFPLLAPPLVPPPRPLLRELAVGVACQCERDICRPICTISKLPWWRARVHATRMPRNTSAGVHADTLASLCAMECTKALASAPKPPTVSMTNGTSTAPISSARPSYFLCLVRSITAAAPSVEDALALYVGLVACTTDTSRRYTLLPAITMMSGRLSSSFHSPLGSRRAYIPIRVNHAVRASATLSCRAVA